MMKMKIRLLSCILLAGLCVGLAACHSDTKDKESSPTEAMTNFLTYMKSGDTMANDYLEEGNHLSPVLAAANGESIPEMDEVYRQFLDQMDSLTFEMGEKLAKNHVMVTVQNKNFGDAILTAMDQAIQTQVLEGGDSFTNFTQWMSAGLTAAELGEQEEFPVVLSERSGAYILSHKSYPDTAFLNGITGGFYDYADTTMTVCTSPEGESSPYSYYLASIGDEVIGCIMVMEEPFDTTGLTPEDIAAAQAAIQDEFAEVEGMYYNIVVNDGSITTTIGINFRTASSFALSDLGFVSGNYNSMTGGHLSLAQSIDTFEKDGMTCVTTPQYEKD